uniref:anionic trypsin-like n=1 Tax=Monopterus albus TaxID=43700 RepID=UPI0009B384A8|nr:anionic trypsin-like [Monopterus albus]
MDGNEQITPVGCMIPHSNYDSWLDDNDIMMIELNKPHDNWGHVLYYAGYLRATRTPARCASAGPVVCNGKLQGIVFWGFGCAEKNYVVISATAIH